MEQRKLWLELRRAIGKHVARVNKSNVHHVSVKLFETNCVRGRGILARAVLANVLTEPDKHTVFALLVALLNLKIPQIGELVAARTVALWKHLYMKNDCSRIFRVLLFLCELVKQKVVEDVVILQILQLLIEEAPTDDAVHLASYALENILAYLELNARSSANSIYDQLRRMLQEGDVPEKRRSDIQFLLEHRRKRPKYLIDPELDLVAGPDKATHYVDLTDLQEPGTDLNYFQEDPEFEVAEATYRQLQRQILSEEIRHERTSEKVENPQKVTDMTDKELLQHQKTIYLTVMSSMSADEAVHKLLRVRHKQKLEQGVLVDMIVKCCAQEKTYSKYFGVIGEKMSGMSQEWNDTFTKEFQQKYDTCYRYEGSQLRNMGKFFGHMIASDNLRPQETLGHVELTETATNSASRVFIKFLFQELVEEMSVGEVKRLIQDPEVKPALRGMFPVLLVDSQDRAHIMFSINFFTAIGLGVLTEEMRLVLKNLPESRGRSSSSGSYTDLASYSRSESYSRSPSRSRSGSRRRYSSGSRSRSWSRSPSRTPSREVEALSHGK